MIQNLRTLFLVIIACAVASGCAESDQEKATGKATLRAVHGIVDAPDLVFRIEARSLGTVTYAASSAAAEYDDLLYNFNFDINIAGGSSRRLATTPLDVAADTEYLFVLTGTLDAPSVTLWQDDERVWDGTETVFELAVAHHNNSLGALDVYFDAPGVAPAPGNELGTISQGERIAPAEFAAGEYVLTITAAGDPGTIHFSSNTRAWSPSTRDTVVILDKNPSRTSPVTVSRISGTGSSTQLADSRFPPQARILHAASGVDNVDLAENNEFGALITSNLAFSDLTADTAISQGTNIYTFTDTGNAGAPIAEGELTVPAGTYLTIALTGPQGEPGVIGSISQRRPHATSGRVGFLNVASAFEFVDIYLLQPEQALDDTSPVISFLPFQAPVPLGATAANNYDMVITISGEKTIVAGPVALDVANGDVIEVLILDTADPNVAQVQVLRHAP